MRKKVLLFAANFICLGGLFAQNSRVVEPFNSGWQFTKDTVNGRWEPVTLPHTYNATDMQLDKDFYTGDGFYKTDFSVTKAMEGKRLYLRFGGVGQVATVYVNGKFLTQHKGGYAAFSFEITNVVKQGTANQILIKTNNKAVPDIIPVNHFLFPIYGGIYRPAALIVTSPVNIAVTDYASPGVQIIQKQVDAESAEVEVKVKLENRRICHQQLTVKTAIADAHGKIVSETQKDITVSPQGVTYVDENITLQNPHLWNGVKDPYLYQLTVSLWQGDKEIDKVAQPLGLKKIELVAGKGVFLNGEKYNMYGVTRHQDRWQYGNALSPEQEKEDMLLIKEMGATTIRLAHYQQSEHIYSLADSLGFLIWAEIPFVNKVTLQESENAKQQMIELVRQNRNHPSIYIWGMHNEVYTKTKDDFVPVLTRQLNDIAKTNDPYRPTVSVNGYGTMERGENLAGDVQGMNRYYGWYEGGIKDLDPWATELQAKYPDYKVMLTEYGADGNIDQSSEFLPETKSIDPVNGQFSPENYQTETHIQQWAIIQKHPYLLASYLWNMFEFSTPYWNRGGLKARNLKGLVTFDRKRKKDAFYWYKANWNPEPMIYIANRRDSVRTQAQTTVQVFANVKPMLKINGKPIKGHTGVNSCHWLFDVKLKKGKNKIEAFSQNKKMQHHDAIVWILK
ncbi:glycoside hydrolase family 2 protein [Niabella insulamsoli]|uniref:glycoside hydrolase family 2 protein n=1 Tax=Niabella insulamsoli TaxID=3144874 RepID=UPI0031FDBC3A